MYSFFFFFAHKGYFKHLARWAASTVFFFFNKGKRSKKFFGLVLFSGVRIVLCTHFRHEMRFPKSVHLGIWLLQAVKAAVQSEAVYRYS